MTSSVTTLPRNVKNVVQVLLLMERPLCLNRFIVPISCVICNDIMAYMFGFFFGRTPLIKVGCFPVH